MLPQSFVCESALDFLFVALDLCHVFIQVCTETEVSNVDDYECVFSQNAVVVWPLEPYLSLGWLVIYGRWKRGVVLNV